MTQTGEEQVPVMAHMVEPLSSAAAVGSFDGYRILVYGMNYAPEIAGVGKYTGEIAEYFSAEGADVTVVTTPPHYPGWVVRDGFANRYGTSIENGVRVRRTPLFLRRKMSGIWRLFAPLSFALCSAPVVLFETLRRRPQIVFCIEPTLFAAPVAQFAAWLVGAKTVLQVQDLEVDAAFAVGHLGSKAWLKKLGYAFERAALRRFSKVITISNRMAEGLLAKGVAKDRLTIARNWVDLSHIYPMTGENGYRKELGFEQDDYVVLYSGNIGAKQGLNVLLDAADALKNDRQIKFVVAGEGPVKADLEKRYGHLANVQFLPFQPYERLNEFMNMADLHALPQEKGAADLVLPSKLGGMLASGKSIIVTADPETELAEFLGDAAVITQPGDSAGLAEGIKLARTRTAVDDRQSRLARSLDKTISLALISACLKQ
ncbi:WcaI family glycosyltransferase [Oryzibacter oryziterrae]|uniref:WcaI family glycosyltransferase n=1 Tax=Oryzibacter oryziterrae TaxID=2766474 RepID=UPI001F3590F2|nr:WcaI family glycosyltransferase [Oryzibacter oryziterrae]